MIEQEPKQATTPLDAGENRIKQFIPKEVIKKKTKYFALPNTVILKRKLAPLSIALSSSPELAKRQQQQEALNPLNSFIVHDIDSTTSKDSNLKIGELVRLIVIFGEGSNGKTEYSINPLGLIIDKEEDGEYVYLVTYPNGGILCKIIEEDI